MTRYVRQIALPEIGNTGQARLAAASVLVVGAGGLGSSVLPLLAGAGIGQISIVDPDVVELGNLHRQTLFRMSDLGQPKAKCAARSLIDLNPDCRVVAHDVRLDPANAPSLLAGVDLVLDAADSFAVSYALSDLCQDRRVPMITASVLGRAGYVAGVCGPAPSLRAVFPDLPMTAQTCAENGVMGPAVAVIGAVQAQMAMSVLLDHNPSPLGQLMRIDLGTWRSTGFRFDTAPEPSGPGKGPDVIALSQIRPDDHVVDLRLAADLGIACPADLPGERLVFVCHSGLRAWRAARRAIDQGHSDVAIVGAGDIKGSEPGVTA